MIMAVEVSRTVDTPRRERVYWGLQNLPAQAPAGHIDDVPRGFFSEPLLNHIQINMVFKVLVEGIVPETKNVSR